MDSEALGQSPRCAPAPMFLPFLSATGFLAEGLPTPPFALRRYGGDTDARQSQSQTC